ncbi:hypothetical protein LTR78_005092 [Recurvomyces mirabilis]|uniref:Uncharacterized protein n=1 Tax=Recurvomyces mirabilis TaxID=574656 RepID=A0AAE0WNU1_9PEZI|nr:hypothetical protein LTR78_005092 [Recurvomyces mirabilis]KAK5158291.1 hypothetical protein LTS14_003309 [Recurvomyces mirabilis]
MPLTNPQGSHLGLILPLCTSSATLGLALFQYPLFLSFLQQPTDLSNPKSNISGKPLSTFWSTFMYTGTSVALAITTTSAIAGLLSAQWLRTHATLETTDVSKWYTYGAVLAAGHLLFVPAVGGPIGRIVENGKGEVGSESEVERSNAEEQKMWLVWHTVRTLTVDLGALLCFAEGAALSLWVI